MQKLDEAKDKEILEAWKTRAAELKTPEELAAFVTDLITNYQHDYGTICHAAHAAMKGAMAVVNHSPQGGITGFQASCIGWMQIHDLFLVSKDDPMRLVNYGDMIYPQYATTFRTISKETWEYLREKARKELATSGNMDGEVRAHMQSVVAGRVPFGYTVVDEQ